MNYTIPSDWDPTAVEADYVVPLDLSYKGVPLCAMTDVIEMKLISVAAAFLKSDPALINLDSGPGDVPRWDSFAQVGLVAEVEATFDLAFDVEDIAAFETLRDIHDAIKLKIGN